MSQTIVIDLPEETKAALDIAVREEGMSQNELIEKALKDYLFIRRFRNLREQMMSQSSKDYTDQDIFDQVS
jgi:metal-responsive CopG/Arc/MetJ family transcriptional regulator